MSERIFVIMEVKRSDYEFMPPELVQLIPADGNRSGMGRTEVLQLHPSRIIPEGRLSYDFRQEMRFILDPEPEECWICEGLAPGSGRPGEYRHVCKKHVGLHAEEKKGCWVCRGGTRAAAMPGNIYEVCESHMHFFTEEQDEWKEWVDDVPSSKDHPLVWKAWQKRIPKRR